MVPGVGGGNPHRPHPDPFDPKKPHIIPVTHIGLVKEKPIRALIA